MIELIPHPKSPIPEVFRDAANALVAALLAPTCAVCSALLDEPLSGCVCASCWRSVLPITPPVCDRCGDPLPRLTAIDCHSICGRCSTSNGLVRRARAIGPYEGTLRDIVHALKYSGRLSLARPLAELMRYRGQQLLADADCVVPVPLHWRRTHQRGFNQAFEIARHLGLPVVKALRRRRATRPQVELAADRRRANVAGAFAVRRPLSRGPALQGKRVLLIDDVSTTGATLESCARVLKDCGASDVYALTAARVVTGRPHGR
jgi:ComF family protein